MKLALTHELMDQKELNLATSFPEKIAATELSKNSLADTIELNAPTPQLTISSLRETLQPLLKTSLAKKQEWISRTDFLFNKLKALDKLEKVSKLGSHYLEAYLLTKSAHYANYQANQLKHTNFTLQKYLHTLATEITTESKCIQAYLRKEVNN